MARVVPRTCNVCEAMCGMLATVDDGGRISDLRGDPDDPFSRGHICPKGPAMREVLEDPDRLKHPVRRTARGFERISWDEAFRECAQRLGEIQARGGADAVGAYVGNPSVHNHSAIIVLQAFLRGLRTKNRFDANSMDANPRLFASMLLYGDVTAIPVPDVDRTDYLLMLGANPAASNGSLMSLGDVRGRLKGITARGGKLVLFDPRRTETAAWASEHHFIRPGGDAAFLAALVNVVFSEKLAEGRVRPDVNGVAAIRDFVAAFTPERTARASGVPADVARRVARDFCAAKRAVCYARVGASVQEFGCEANWLVDVLNAVTGNLDVEGGAMFTTPAVDLGKLSRAFGVGRSHRWKSRVRGLPEFGGQLPVVTMAEEMETPGPGQIRGFVTLAGNPALSAPHAARLDRALAALDFYVAVDFYVNETTRHAHIILPPRHALERSHMDVVLASFAVRNVVKYSERVVEPAEDTKEDWEILYELGMRLGGLRFGLGPVDAGARAAWKLGLKVDPERLIDAAVRFGAWGDKLMPGGKGLTLKKIRQSPHGIDLGALKPSLAAHLHTPSKKVELAPAMLVEQKGRLGAWVDAVGRDELVLIGRRHLRTNNSWMHNCHSLTKGPDRAQLMMNAGDAAKRGLRDGQSVRVSSRIGAVDATLSATDDLMPGVVSLPHGYGHAAVVDTMKVAGALPGPNVNVLVDDSTFEPVLGTAILNGVPVRVEAAGAAGAGTGAGGAGVAGAAAAPAE